jgi:hypothetical protein
MSVALVAGLTLAGVAARRSKVTYERAVGTERSRSSVDPLLGQLIEETGRLQAALARNAEGPRMVRDPFALVRESSPPMASIEVSAPIVLPAASNPEPVLTLLGVATDQKEGQLVRTAILAGNGDELYMVGRDAVVAERYRIARIDTEAVELVDVRSGAARRLTLK